MTSQVYNLDGPKEFPFPYPVRAAAQLTVEIVPGGVVSPGDYEVVGVGPTSTQVTVRYPNAPTTGGLQLKISRYVAPERVTVIDDPSDITTVNLNAEFNNIYEALIDFEEFILNLVQQMLDDFQNDVLDPALVEITQLRDDAVAAKDAAEGAATDAQNSATAAANSETLVAGYATDAEAAATSASNSATNADGSATSAAASAQTATTAADTASGHAASANTAAQSAESSATDAQTSANAANQSSLSATAAKDAAEDAQQGAEQAEQGATAAWDAFQDRYWGAYPTDPSVSPVGNPPTAGDLYWNTTVNQWRAWDANQGAWVSVTSAVPTYYDRRNYIATEGQTTFDAQYDAGFVQVWVNGLLLPPSDYEASTGTEVVLDEGVAAGTEVTIVGLGTYSAGVSTSWGEIGGKIADQADLYSALTNIGEDIDSLEGLVTSGLQGGAPIYPDTATGLANTAEGEFFTVPGTGDDYSILYRHDPGDVAFEVARSPSAGAVRSLGDQINDAVASIPGSVDIIIRDALRQQVEAATGGLCTVLYTANGEPSYFRMIPRFNCEDIAPGGELGTGTHEAFIRNGTTVSEIFVGMYLMSTVAGEGVSQPRAIPQWSINYSVAQSRIQACGPGFDLMTCWDWAAVVFWSMANGYEVTGNTNYGRHHDKRWETGARVDGGEPGDTTNASSGQTLTGTGPLGWRHDGTPAGIADMVGNLWEWQGGFKTVDGRAFIAPDNGDHAELDWGDTGFDMPSNGTWSSIDASAAPESLKRALIVPNGALDPGGQYYINQEGERLPFRGGSRSAGGDAGLGALLLSSGRAYASPGLGARPRFRNL